MTETRAVAKLPSLDVEIRHRHVPEEGAEYIAITLKATPDLESVAAWLDPLRMLGGGPGASLWQAWQQAATMLWAPWLGLANGRLRALDERPDRGGSLPRHP